MKEMTGQPRRQSRSSQERPRYLKMRISARSQRSQDRREVQPLLPRIEDSFQVFTCASLRPSDLEGSAGVYRLKEELFAA